MVQGVEPDRLPPVRCVEEAAVRRVSVGEVPAHAAWPQPESVEGVHGAALRLQELAAGAVFGFEHVVEHAQRVEEV